GEVVEAETDLPAIVHPTDDLDLLRGQPGGFSRVVVLDGDGQHSHRPCGQCRLVERAGEGYGFPCVPPTVDRFAQGHFDLAEFAECLDPFGGTGTAPGERTFEDLLRPVQLRGRDQLVGQVEGEQRLADQAGEDGPQLVCRKPQVRTQRGRAVVGEAARQDCEPAEGRLLDTGRQAIAPLDRGPQAAVPWLAGGGGECVQPLVQPV